MAPKDPDYRMADGSKPKGRRDEIFSTLGKMNAKLSEEERIRIGVLVSARHTCLMPGFTPAHFPTLDWAQEKKENQYITRFSSGQRSISTALAYTRKGV